MRTRKPGVRDRILDATNELLARYGYRKTSMADLARQAGVGKGTLYLYFSSKEDVALSSIDRLIDRLIEALKRIASSDEPVDSRLRRMLVTRVMYRFDHLHQDSSSLDELFAAVRPAFLGRRQRYFNAEAEVFARVLSEGREAGLLDAEDPLETARAILLSTNGLLPYSLSPKELGRRADVEKDAVHIAGLVTHGLRRPLPPVFDRRANPTISASRGPDRRSASLRE
jgi:AcrR family transcriptional regulator